MYGEDATIDGIYVLVGIGCETGTGSTALCRLRGRGRRHCGCHSGWANALGPLSGSRSTGDGISGLVLTRLSVLTCLRLLPACFRRRVFLLPAAKAHALVPTTAPLIAACALVKRGYGLRSPKEGDRTTSR